ncbi:MAG: hypothetical protein IJV94_02465 [Bacilli bacterium]|nr:hypothetical protein [Bacilli bacterium]
MCLKNYVEKLVKVDNADKKISTKGFLIFAGAMIVVILTLVVILSII